MALTTLISTLHPAGLHHTSLFIGLLAAMVMAIAPPKAEAATAGHDQVFWTDQQWLQIKDQVELLDRIAYFPGLLPVIMLHRDSIGLTDEQLDEIRLWRRKNYQTMVGLMNEIIGRRSDFTRNALNNNVSDVELVESQRQLFVLQAHLLRIRLSCRKLILDSFTAEQWSNLAFVLEDYPAFAGLLEDTGGTGSE